jgi:hypothetical protein
MRLTVDEYEKLVPFLPLTARCQCGSELRLRARTKGVYRGLTYVCEREGCAHARPKLLIELVDAEDWTDDTP